MNHEHSAHFEHSACVARVASAARTARTMLVLIAAVSCLAAALCLTACGSSAQSSSTNASSSAASADCVTQAEGVYASGAHHAVVTVQGYDPFTIELDADAAPVSVWNFCTLAESGAYNGSTFHRIVSDFCLQGGDPTGTGTGTGDYTIVGEFSANNIPNALADDYREGTVAWARLSTSNDSASLQWFITLSDKGASSLNGQYAAFGTVDTAGMEIVQSIVNDYVSNAGSNGIIADKASQPVIESIEITD